MCVRGFERVFLCNQVFIHTFFVSHQDFVSTVSRARLTRDVVNIKVIITNIFYRLNSLKITTKFFFD